MSARTRWDLAMEVARWEFRRFVKPKQLLFSLLLTLVSALAGIGLVRLFDDDDEERVALAVVGAEALGLDADTLGARFALRRAAGGELPALRDAVGAKELEGLLVARADGGAELLVRKRPSWRAELERELAAARQRARVAESGIAPAALARIFEPVALDVAYHEAGRPPSGRGERLLTIVVLALAFTGLMSGIGYAFAGITGEKQQRITEQIVSAIPPQSWMDGKILGLAAVSLVNALTTGLAFLALYLGGRAFAPALRTPFEIGDPVVALLVVVVPLLGFLLWFSFLCAVAAVIDDPNSSTKGPLIMVPLLSLAVAGFVFVRPDGAVSQFFSVFPLTGWVVLPARLMLTEVPWWEVAAAIALLVAATWLFRRAAGKIFAVGMLMYGKEPTLREMLRWAREPV